MKYLYLILVILFIISLVFNYLYISEKKTAIQIVNEMGIGYNLGNTFDCFNFSLNITNPDEQITLYGNPIPTKKMIKMIKKFGFKTIRFPITWIYFIDEIGNINSEWISRIKEVVNWIIKNDMYCILNVHHDGESENWLSKGLIVKDKYINLWTQIANEFKDYNDYLIFESMNKVIYLDLTYNYDYNSFLNLTQAFVDTIRNSGGNNIERLLIISAMYSDIDLACSKEFKMPYDLSKMLAISIHYDRPIFFTSYNLEFLIWSNNWGNEADYNELVYNFDKLKEYFTDKGIPVIISEVGVITEYQKDLTSIREYLYAVFSISSEYDGIMSCLWDTSNKNKGNMNYYNRELSQWYDEKIQKNFLDISKGKYFKFSEYFILSNSEIVSNIDGLYFILLNIGVKKAMKIILNVNLKGELFEDLSFNIITYNKKGETIYINFDKRNGKKQYDGSTIFTIDISKEDCNEYIEVTKLFGNELIQFNNLTVEYNDSFLLFDCKSYKNAIFNNVN